MFKVTSKATKKSSSIFSKIKDIFSKKEIIDKDSLDKIYNSMLEADIGPAISTKLIEEIKNYSNFDSALEKLKVSACELIAANEVNFLKDIVVKDKLNVILMIGINGSGKTTTTGKLASLLLKQKLTTCVAACDTFRAAAVEQLKKTCENINCKVITPNEKIKDPSSVAYEAVKYSLEDCLNALIIDTAGRVHTQENLMEELAKIHKVVDKAAKDSNVVVVLTIDGSVGQNSIDQVREFSKRAKIDGLIVTKLDSSSKGGAIVNIVHNHKTPVFFICHGESINDISEFNSKSFIDSIF